MVRPDAPHSVTTVPAPSMPAASDSASDVPCRGDTDTGASMRTDTDMPRASAICEASVRFQISS